MVQMMDDRHICYSTIYDTKQANPFHLYDVIVLNIGELNIGNISSNLTNRFVQIQLSDLCI